MSDNDPLDDDGPLICDADGCARFATTWCGGDVAVFCWDHGRPYRKNHNGPDENDLLDCADVLAAEAQVRRETLLRVAKRCVQLAELQAASVDEQCDGRTALLRLADELRGGT